ncbi:MAG: S9 family peptidase [Burkholderiaceae bacterium]|nr:S9 family peptidase [Rhodoferax sp.]MCP5285043.1 S9 family peptidase [Burkholderiaceae bacterium]
MNTATRCWRRGRALAVALTAGLTLLGTLPASATTAADYARPPAMRSMIVSPANTHAALLARAPSGRTVLTMLDLKAPGTPRVIKAYDDVDIVEVSWVNDRRLVYSAQQPGALIEYEKWGTFAIDLDGNEEQHLVTARSDTVSDTGSRMRQRVLPRGWDFWRAVGDGSDDVYMTRWLDSAERGLSPQVVARVNTRTMAQRTVSEGAPEGATGWWFDAAGRLTVVTTAKGDREQLWWQPAAGEPWQVVREWASYDSEGKGLEPQALERDGTLIVAARATGDTQALHTFDLRQRKLDPAPLVGVAGYDVNQVIFDHRLQQVIGVPVDAAQRTTVWFDEGLARAQAVVDKALPAGRSNVLLCGQRCAGATRFVVASAGDRQPWEYFLYDVAAGQLRPLGMTRPWIDPATQGRRSAYRIPARDGLQLPVIVTHPPGVAADQPAPTVVLVHGGPWAPGASLTWEPESQFLATRGYRVLEVSFRGTTGLGWKHEQASWRQYGLAMQDDLQDAVRWAVAQKLSDPRRVCIYGASYGGYAALMGPVQHPDTYRCAASHVGVTDLSMLFSANWTDIAALGRKVGLPRLIGDPQADADMLKRMSPVNRAADIKVPVFLAQGRLDQRVTPEHADRFVSAARAAGVDIERVDYEEGHGFASTSALTDFWQRLAAFFDRHIGTR